MLTSISSISSLMKRRAALAGGRRSCRGGPSAPAASRASSGPCRRASRPLARRPRRPRRNGEFGPEIHDVQGVSWRFRGFLQGFHGFEMLFQWFSWLESWCASSRKGWVKKMSNRIVSAALSLNQKSRWCFGGEVNLKKSTHFGL